MTTDDHQSAMASQRPIRWVAGILALAGLFAFLIFLWARNRTSASEPNDTTVQQPATQQQAPIAGGSVTHVYAHNLRLHRGPDFKIYIRWLRGELVPTTKNQVPSFDAPDSFSLNVTNGVIRANLGDICNYLNASAQRAPLKNVRITGSGDQVTITGTLHKLIPLPVKLSGIIKAASGNRIQMQIMKIAVLKIPVKGLLSDFHITLADVFHSDSSSGIQAIGNDIYFDPEQMLPPPHIRGQLTSVSMTNPDLEAVYGDAREDIEKTEQWRNFLRLRDGSLDFGKLTMHQVDLMMIDISQDAWFDLDLANYQAQLVNGYTRMTPQAGLQVFMPDVSDLKKSTEKDISIEWFKNRNIAAPASVFPDKK